MAKGWCVGVGILCCYLVGQVWASGTTTAALTSSPGPGLFYCFDCNSASEACPGDRALAKEDEESKKIVVANCTLGQKCYTREYNGSGSIVIHRGCTKVIGGNLPNPLPEDGCYDYNGYNFCVCSGDRCNKDPIGHPTGVKINAHLLTASGGIIPPKYVPRGNKPYIVCNVCNSGTPDEPNNNCRVDRAANWKTSWKKNCTGRCITKTNFLFPNVDVFRECSDDIPSYPNPFPVDGCYKWYTDTVCVCNSDLCNTGPLGTPGVELDAHIPKPDPSGAHTRTLSHGLLPLLMAARTFL